MAWAAAVRHWSGLLWALSGAVGWMITKPLWTPAVRRWKLYEALFQTPMVVLEDEAESEGGLGRLAHRWLEDYHALRCVFLPDVLELSWKSTVKYWIGSSAECHRAMDRACCVFRAFASLMGLFAYAGLYTAVYVYEFVEWILYGSCGVGALLLLGNYVLAERHFGVDGGFAWNDDMVLASGLTVLLAVTSRLLRWGEASKGRRTPKQVAEDRYTRWTKDLEEQEQAERLSEAFWKADGCVGPKPNLRRLSEVRARRDTHRARKADQGPTGARRGRQASVGEGVTSGSGGHRLGHGEFRYPPPLFSTADQIRVGHAFDEAMQGHDGVAEKLWAGLGLRGTSAARARWGERYRLAVVVYKIVGDDCETVPDGGNEDHGGRSAGRKEEAPTVPSKDGSRQKEEYRSKVEMPDLEWMKNRDPYCNVGESIAAKIGVNLHRQPNHPLHIIKTKIESYFDNLHQNHGAPKFTVFDDLDPVVTTYDCFDSMLVPTDHVSRKVTDTYYVDQNRVLRAHTSAHEVATMKNGFTSFLVSGDVYRRDEIDASHYPVFHQMEGVRIFSELDATTPREEKVAHVKEELKKTLEGMAKELFGDVEMRWVEAYFPFTEPSLELEIFFNGDWLEVLGCGVLQQEIVRNAGLGENVGWAFGLGLERLAMVLFDIPDIRLFWSQDTRFISQFKDGEITKFKPYSKYPECFKDVSFWYDDDFHENNLCEVVRDIAGDMVEQVAIVDEFTHPKTQRTSKCYRITYRHMDRNLTNSEVDDIQEIVRAKMVTDLGVELR
ncbi:hypothetical protein PInf_003135 [Phytophthora infestans]|nr:hypothetical protein PInf_003135 [Phytophthora infestans]